jgi:SAM-dependent methyltransferase
VTTTSRPGSPAFTGVDDWDTHWERLGAASESNPAQAYRRALALFLLGRREAPKRLLDIGSGTGALLEAAKRRWPTAGLAGVDLSPGVVAAAQRRVPSARLRACDLLREPIPTAAEAGWATHAVCSEVLEHVNDPVLLLRNARAWLAPGCRIVVTVPGGPMSVYDRHIGHRRHFTQRDLAEVMVAAGLEVRMVAAAGFPFFNLYRGVVIARGEHLVDDVDSEAGRSPRALLMRVVMAGFRPLLMISLPRSPLGWQTIGVASEPCADRVAQ